MIFRNGYKVCNFWW